MLYFAYGSNMSTRRLGHRISSARKLGVAILAGHQLKFHKRSLKDDSAKCDIEQTGRADDRVYGVLFDIHEADREVLDGYEGLGQGYEIKTVDVRMGDETCQAFAYYATLIEDDLRPYHWYKQHVLVGARENDLPADYLAMIETVESMDDPDVHRRQREMAVHDDCRL